MNHREDVWLDGVEDYISHAKSLLIEAADSDSPVSGLKEGTSQAHTDGRRQTMARLPWTEARPGKASQLLLASLPSHPLAHL